MVASWYAHGTRRESLFLSMTYTGISRACNGAHTNKHCCKCGLERHDRTHLCESAEPCGLQTARLVLLRGGGGAGSANTAPAGRHHPRYLAFKMRMCRYWQRPGSSRLVFVLDIASMFAAILYTVDGNVSSEHSGHDEITLSYGADHNLPERAAEMVRAVWRAAGGTAA